MMPSTAPRGITIGSLAERTGLGVPTIRSWEQRYGFPVAARAASGHRRYDDDQVDAVERVLAARDRGLSLAAAIRSVATASEVPSLFAALGAVAPASPVLELSGAAMRAISRAIEDEALAAGGAMRVVGAFQRPAAFDSVRGRWEELARGASVAIAFASFARRRTAGGIHREPLDRSAPLRREWAVACETVAGAACLAGWEQPREPGAPRRFEARWTVDPDAVAAVIDRALSVVPAGSRPPTTDRTPPSSDPVGWATAVSGRALRYGLGGAT